MSAPHKEPTAEDVIEELRSFMKQWGPGMTQLEADGFRHAISVADTYVKARKSLARREPT